MGFKEFMSEQRGVSRWFILRIALAGVLCGVILGFVWFGASVIIS